ncbi:phenylacetate--CoA ligase [Geomesophilobacter sediminis]|uniref:Phenylacetate-coenzyme A ligase n=1 Tax=Geomesophilobacter sediminis TaxID=2798584 RepID=A0A8J7ING5_9BACT|nr:phenylacetate--CoA ligase [Geomesophilobacter sediminis]MBJ6723589.1 phenylacetate--CoA ligase [Geomesophilobacter sediminis]
MLKRFPAKVSPADLAAHQLAGLQWTVRHAYENSPFYREKLSAAGVTPDSIGSLDDLKRLPLLTAQDLAEGYPFALRSVPFTDLVRIHASSGTTGKRKVLCYTQKDLDDWQSMFARCYELAGLTREDRVQIAVGYGLWTAGAGFQLACEKFGALAIPVGPGNLDMQIGLMIDLETTVFCCTASMGLLLAEEVLRQGLRDKLKLKKVILGAERSSSAMLATMKAGLGVEEIYDIPGLTEVYGPGTGLSCGREPGIHYWADYYILELLDPITLEPVAPGEVGEMVYTTLGKEGAPLIRYRSRDLTRLIVEPCPCGCTLPRHDRILGRSDDVVIFRGVNIYPGQVDEVLHHVEGIGSEYQVHLGHGSDGRDFMTVKVERAAGAGSVSDPELQKRIASAIKHKLIVSCNVEVVAYGTMPRSERKTKRIFDERNFE